METPVINKAASDQAKCGRFRPTTGRNNGSVFNLKSARAASNDFINVRGLKAALPATRGCDMEWLPSLSKRVLSVPAANSVSLFRKVDGSLGLFN